MCKILYSIFPFLRKEKNLVVIKNVTDSTIGVNLYNGSTVVNRAEFEINDDWFEQLLSITYDEEIKCKYVPELHQSTEFEVQLMDILKFKKWKGVQINQVRICIDYLRDFEKSCMEFHQMLSDESITINNPESPFIIQLIGLIKEIDTFRDSLSKLQIFFELNDYQILKEVPKITTIPSVIDNPITYNKDNWDQFLDKEPSDFYTIAIVFRRLKQVYYNLGDLNRMLVILKSNINHKIIAGNAGTGKTHISAHIIKTIRENGDYIIFLKPKYFNGDNVNFEERVLQLLQIPIGYTLYEVLIKLNDFATEQNKRCFILIDALNETTKSSIGFSNIWNINLQNFINQIGLFSNLYFISTLRSSYIEQIWPIRPSNIIEIGGFVNDKEVVEGCKKYFDYYKIKPSNWDTADLSYFKVPLLLDLFCKLTNSSRESEKEIELGIQSYLQVFENYISELVVEVKRKLGLLKDKAIVNGFNEVATKFWIENEAIVLVNDFNDSFDKDDLVTADKSIARSVLEGYLIFIKDFIEIKKEIVKHTQQEVGGYLLAKEISNNFPNILDLIQDKDFIDKIIGDDLTKHHQLRLDILKFLIAIRPEIIEHLKDIDSLRLSWWYLFNGFNPRTTPAIPKFLLEEKNSRLIVADILSISSDFWFQEKNDLNFNFISKILAKLELWEFEEHWTFYIYKNVISVYEFINNSIKQIKINDDANYQKEILIAKFISLVTSTNIRELRDLSTIYLIEFGKKHPIHLLEITENVSTLKDSYIYERLASCMYGVALNLQNDKEYLDKHLFIIARRLYNLQFANEPIAPVYNYIVIDSIKHLLDLAIVKGKHDLSLDEIDRISNYIFQAPYDWIPPTEEQFALINKSSQMHWPDPIGMDFGIYTIPRLMITDYVDDRKAISHVYKRIFELGYKNLKSEEFTDESYREFYWGISNKRFGGKIDRLGKKYSWKGFFDYAGFLLLERQLNVFEKGDSAKEHYVRLGDIDIDICLPNQDYKLDLRLYTKNLISKIDQDINWYKESQIDTISPLFNVKFENEQYTMLYGKIDQKLNDDYKVRSYLLAETFFIKKNTQIEKLRKCINTLTFDWDKEIHFSVDRLRHVYFGELYWADSFYEDAEESVGIPTGNILTKKRKISYLDTIHSDCYEEEDIGKELNETYDEKLYFQSDPSLAEYLWESESKTLKGYSEYYPSVKMGKSLGLKVEPKVGKILDADLKECFICVEHADEKHFSNTLNYMRSDLLNNYMSENDLILVYQVKQHSYDDNNEHIRLMKFFILE